MNRRPPRSTLFPYPTLFRSGERRRGRERGEPVEAVLEDRIDVAIGAGLDGAGPGARRFEPLPAVALGQAQDAEARAIALLGMRTVREDLLDQGGRLGADRARPVDEARRRPLQMALVRLRHVGSELTTKAGRRPRSEQREHPDRWSLMLRSRVPIIQSPDSPAAAATAGS